MDEKTMVVALTVGELTHKIREVVQAELAQNQENNYHFPRKKAYAFGYQGIADTFGVSRISAYRILRSGIIDGAISQVNRQIVLDVEKALEITSKQRKNKKIV